MKNSKKYGGVIEVSLFIHHETDMAYLVSEDRIREEWIPKSQCQIDEEVYGDDDGRVYKVIMPMWLYKEKGFS